MDYSEFQEYWVTESNAELAAFRNRPAADLLDQISRADYGSYHQIWYALVGRTTFKEAGSILIGVLRSGAPYLVRYHCAVLLLTIQNPRPDVFSAVKLSGRNKYDVDWFINEYVRALGGC